VETVENRWSMLDPSIDDLPVENCVFFCTSTSMLVSRRWANYKWRRYGGNSSSMTLLVWILSGWWFQTCFYCP
jgi:hypothetical protein